jgi:hypothetical protein
MGASDFGYFTENSIFDADSGGNFIYIGEELADYIRKFPNGWLGYKSTAET